MDHITENFNHVERALYYAIRFMARMDECAGSGNATDVPEVIAWAVEQVKPELVAPLRESGGYAQFLEMLKHLRPLREAAERFRRAHIEAVFWGVPGEDEGYLTLQHLCHQLGSRVWRRTNISGKRSIERVIRAATSRYGDEKYRPFPQRDVGGELQFTGPTLVPPNATSTSPAIPDLLDAELPMGTDAAFQYAKAQFLACDDGAHRYWHATQATVAGDWLTHDMPEAAARIIADGLVESFSATVREFVRQMLNVERYWTLLSYPIRMLLLRSNDEALVTQIINALIRNTDFPPGKLGDAWAERVWAMVKRRAIRPKNALAVPILSSESNALIRTIRGDQMMASNCFVVERSSLPQPFSSLVHEGFAFIVQAPEGWLDAEDMLESDYGLTLQGYQADCNEDSGLFLRLNKALYVHTASLWPHLFRFKRILPILYVFREQTALVGYEFNLFLELAAVSNLPREWVQWTKAEEFEKLNPRPRFATTVHDLTQVPSPTALAEAMDRLTRSCQSSNESAVASDLAND